MNAPPLFLESPKSREVLQGSPAEIKCKAMGKPRPEIKWYKDGKQIKTQKKHRTIESKSEDDDSLEIVSCMNLSEVLVEDESVNYRIEAINKVGKAEHVLGLTGEIRLSIISIQLNFYIGLVCIVNINGF